MPPVKAYQIPDWANPANASVLDNWWTRTARTIGQFMGVNDPESQVMGLATAPIDVPAADAAGAVTQTLKAYHGSPHDFERFDSSKIGTGEGTQAFSHGLYFAQREGVADNYRQLATPKVVIGGEAFPVPSWSPELPPQERVIRRLADYRAKYPNLSVDDIIAKVKYDLEKESLSAFNADVPESRLVKHLADQQSILDMATQRGIDLPRAGKMYEVNLHTSPEELLDWDKPLSQQPPKVQEALRASGISPEPEGRHLVAGRVSSAGFRPIPEGLDPTGGDIIQHYMSADAPETAETLRRAGINGVQFLDRGSRAAGQGTRNFVIFPGNEHLIDIARKYGISLAAAKAVYDAQQRTKPQPAQTGVE